jgi:hypothetical protein
VPATDDVIAFWFKFGSLSDPQRQLLTHTHTPSHSPTYRGSAESASPSGDEKLTCVKGLNTFRHFGFNDTRRPNAEAFPPRLAREGAVEKGPSPSFPAPLVQ